MKRDFCSIRNFKPSVRTMDMIEEMNRITDMATLLGALMVVIPILQIFGGRRTYHFASNNQTKKLQIANSDWKSFADAMESVPKIQRMQLEKIALDMEFRSSGEERKFWECVYNAL